MLREEMGDIWIYSCGNWVGVMLFRCPEYCEDRDVLKPTEHQEREKRYKSVYH
jgi:hypothetical protein